MKVIHNLKPIYNENSKILILGSLPSVVSRENNFYYANKTNRFWKILESVFSIKLNTNEEKEKFLLNNYIALWDVISSCNIKGSSDLSIKNVKVNNIDLIISKSSIKHIFCTGKAAYNLFNKHIKTNIPVSYLSSPSSANAKKSLNDLINEYKVIKKYLK